MKILCLILASILHELLVAHFVHGVETLDSLLIRDTWTDS